MQFNNWIEIQLKRIEMHIGGESIENFLVNMVLEKKNLKLHIYKKNLSMLLYLGMG
jgi:hypothetical protein